MHCPKCGVEVMEQAGFCHKCGAELDAAESEFSAEEVSPPSTSAEEQPPATPIEKMQQAVASRRDVEDEAEEDLWRGGYSSKAMLGAWVLSSLVTVALVIFAFWAWQPWVGWPVAVGIPALWLYQLSTLCYRRWNIRYHLTNQRFIHQTGILRRVTDRIEVIDMDDITSEQKLLERVVGVGTIRISSSDRSHPELIMLGIENVKEVATLIDETRRAERRRRGLHIESI